MTTEGWASSVSQFYPVKVPYHKRPWFGVPNTPQSHKHKRERNNRTDRLDTEKQVIMGHEDKPEKPDLLSITEPQALFDEWLLITQNHYKIYEGDEWLTSVYPHLEVHKTFIPAAGLSSDRDSSSSSSIINPSLPALRLPSATFTLTVQPHHCNRIGSLHGGCVASVYDYVTTMAIALVAKPGQFQYLGVTRNLNVNYLRPAAAGDTVYIECEVLSAGKTMALVKGTMRRESDGAVLSTCLHDKYNTDPPVAKL